MKLNKDYLENIMVESNIIEALGPDNLTIFIYKKLTKAVKKIGPAIFQTKRNKESSLMTGS